MLKRAAPFFVIGFVAALTLIIGKMLWRTDARALAVSVAQPAAVAGKAPPAHARGPENAPITLEEFGDFQCPACAEVSAMIHKFTINGRHSINTFLLAQLYDVGTRTLSGLSAVTLRRNIST